ncbi:SDR family NAD(P)-dependent oxidoreductase|uniref:Acyl transferase domain-containing protein n=1 Tax=Dendrosporobacter quercicolus TaxID=146817 RepID=A0A1G9KMX1_9FIRM|nr:SDR family NAD(P)-dependent oxidoreductase [Dendrosporobacter quercicolus]NSL46455.1 SDR family NAD(P)-dependent oxidoreductase [Dendrosporobacter quercicolus DSM 1736]SDL51052.1 Acyl transferase domain-containing protein [Dendrosporobacter quercicolus]
MMNANLHVYQKNIENKVKKVLAGIVNNTSYPLNFDKSFSELGINSVLAVELVEAVNQELEIELGIEVVFDYSNVKDLANHIANQYHIANGANKGKAYKKYSDISSHEVIEQELKKIIADLLRDSTLDLDKSFLDLGINSVLAVELIEAVNQKFEIQLGIEVVFDYSGVKELAQVIISRYGEEWRQKNGKRSAGYNHLLRERSLGIKKAISSEESNNNQAFLVKERDSIAIIGISGKFADSDTIEEFWDHIKSGHSCIAVIDRKGWDEISYFHPDFAQKNRSVSKWGGLLRNIDRFDPAFFDISPREAERMDPQQRLFLTEAFKAFEDGGYSAQQLSGTKVGVFVGGRTSDYKEQTLNQEEINSQTFLGNDMSILAARISYFLNLKGPSLAVDTACSSSLVAIHLACNSLLKGESEIALAGGVFIISSPEFYVMTSKTGMLSPDGQCKTFDNSANGIVVGEGVGAVVLKRLESAIRDGDHIYGVIKGSAINQDGKTKGITSPSMLSQKALIYEAYKNAAVHPETVSYIEAHGTGTKLGDPIEIKALSEAFRMFTAKTQFCAIGSHKPNIGHTIMSAGIAGVFKILMAMKYKMLPPTISVEKINEHINFNESPFFINTRLTEWKSSDGNPLRAGVSSFGFSGTNCHVIIEEPPVQQGANKHVRPYYLFTFSAKTKTALNQRIIDMNAWLEKEAEQYCLGDISYTLLIGRSHFSVRCAFIASNIDELKQKIMEIYKNETTDDFFSYEATSSPKIQLILKKYGERLVEELQQSDNSDWENYKEKLLFLAELYANEYNLEWAMLYKKGSYCRVPLPTYPFCEDNYCILTSTEHYLFDNDFAGIIHPLIHRNISNFAQQQFSSTFTGRELFLADHIVKGKRVLPGVACLEMARVAVDLASGSQSMGIRLKNVSWTRQMSIQQQSVQVFIRLDPEDNGEIAFEIYSYANETDTGPVIHSRGSAVLSSTLRQGLTLDIAALQAKCTLNTLSAKQCYDAYCVMGLDYGPGHKGVELVYIGLGEVLAKLSLPGFVSNTLHQYVLHPSVMDSALQASIGLKIGNCIEPGKLALPFAVQEIEIIDRCTSRMWAWLRYSEGSKAGDKVEKLDIDLCDENGTICVRMRGFSTRVLEAEGETAKASATPGTLLLRPCWNKKPINREDKFPIYMQHLVILCEMGHISQEEVVSHIPGSHCIILQSKQDNIVDRFETYALRVFDEIQNIIKSKPSGKVLIQIVVTNENEQQLFCGLAGLLKTAQLENPKLIGQLIEWDFLANTETIIAKLQENSRRPFDNQICYRDDQRLVVEWNEIISSEEESRIPWKDHGVYLITGGAGGLGIIFAREIVQKVKHVTLILTGRSLLSEEKHTQLRELQALGSRIEYRRTDVTDKKAVADLIQKITEDFGGLNGIIHAAGVLRDNYILNKTKEEWRAVLAPKVLGLVNLDQASEKVNLDFFIFFSSVTGSLGNLGQADYATANAFMDCYSGYRNAQVAKKQRCGQTLSVNWPLWKEGGMHINEESARMMRQSVGMSAMQTSSGILALYQGFASQENQVLVMEGNLVQMKKLMLSIKSGAAAQLKKATIRADCRIDTGLLDTVQAALLQAASNLLKVKTEDSDGNIQLNEFGFDPVTLTEFINQINQEYQFELTTGIVSEHPTLYSLAEYLVENYKEDFVKRFKLASTIIRPEIDLNTSFEKIKRILIQSVSKFLKLKSEAINIYTELSKYGFDSIMLTEFVNILNQEYNLELTPTVFFEYPTIQSFAEYLSAEKHAAFGASFIQSRLESSVQAQPEGCTVKEGLLKNERYSRFARALASVAGQSERVTYEPIAIVGISGIFPMAKDLNDFWGNIVEGKDCITEIPKTRWDWREYFGDPMKEANKTNIKWGGFIDGVDEFDPLFFGISPREAELMDPQQRLLLTQVWKAIEDAGITVETLAHKRTGVYISAAGLSEYLNIFSIPKDNPLAMTSIVSSMIPNRISYTLNLRGPSEYCETACSSVFVALHRAIQCIHRNECEQAVIGAANLLLTPMGFIAFESMGFLSPDGQTKAFQAEANGYVRSEGVGAMIIKPLQKAIEDKDLIYAIIKGTGVAHGGRGMSMTAPNAAGIKTALLQAYQASEIDPRTVSYIEAHGIASPIGDSIEINALKAGFQELTSLHTNNLQANSPQYIGNLNPCIGHGEIVSGMAALFKVIFAIRDKVIPGIPQFTTLHESISLRGSRFQLSAENHKWEELIDSNGIRFPRRASINSYGFGGVNAHIILEEYIPSYTEAADNIAAISPQIVVFSAKNEDRLLAVVKQMLGFLTVQKELSLANFAYTLQIGRQAMKYRMAMVVSSKEELIQGLKEYLVSRQEDKQLEVSIPIFSGNMEEEHSVIGSLLHGRTGETLFQILLAEKNYEKLALYWSQGGNIPWEFLHEGAIVHRISLPAYPFEKKKYWLAQVSDQPVMMDSRYLIHQDDNQPISLNSRIKQMISELLGIPAVELPIREPLANLGFNSMQSVTLRGMLEQVYSTEIPISLVSEHNTIELLDRYLNKLIKPQIKADFRTNSNSPKQSNMLDILPVIIPDNANRHQPFPLNDIQESFLTGRKLCFGGDRVGCHIYFEIEVSSLDIYRLRSAWENLIKYHEMLRCVILNNGQQKILDKTPPYNLKIVDLRRKTAIAQSEYLEDVRENMSHKIYEAEQWPLFEVRISVCPNCKYVIHFSIDELIIDANGVYMLLQQWQQLYEKPGWQLPALNISFRDYVSAIKQFEESKRYKRDLEYWVKRLEQMPNGPTLSCQQQADSVERKEIYYRRRLNGELAEQQWLFLKGKAKKLNVSVTTLVLSIFSEFIRAWSDNEAFSLIITFFNRMPLHPQIQQVLGPYISTNIFVVEPKRGRSFEAWISYNQDCLFNDLDHSYVSGVRVLREIKARNKIPTSIYLPVVFTSLVNNFETQNGHNKESFFKRISYMVTQTPQVYLDHQIFEQDQKLKFSWDVAEEYFGANVIRSMFAAYCRFIYMLSCTTDDWNLDTLTSKIISEKLFDGNLKSGAYSEASDNVKPAPVKGTLPKGLKLEVLPDDKFKPFPLTDQQQAYAYARSALMPGGNNACQIYHEFEVEELDIGRLEKAWNKLLQTHDMLVAVIQSDGIQRILQEVPEFKIEVVDLIDKKGEALQAELNTIKRLMVTRVFELNKWPYFDLRVSILNNNKFRIHFSIDMLIADGDSIQLLLNQFFHAYKYPAENLKKNDVSFRDYIIALEKYKKEDGYQDSIQYWEKKFRIIPPGPQLPMNTCDNLVSFEQEQFKSVLWNWNVLKNSARILAVPPGMILLSAYVEVLSAWLYHKPFSIVIPCWERLPLHNGINMVVGDFTAMSWLIFREGKNNFKENVQLYHQAVREDLAHLAVSGLKVLRKAVLKAGRRGTLAFPVVFSNLTQSSVNLDNNFTKIETITKTPQVYLDNISEEREGCLHFYWDVAKGLYSDGLIEDMFAGYKRVLEALASTPDNWNKIDFPKLINAQPEKYGILKNDKEEKV